MGVSQTVWTVIVILGCFWWILGAFLNNRTTRLMRPIGEYKSPEPKRWPKVSIVIPARDEGTALEKATRSKLESDFPDFEVIIVDDRSTDDTPEIADRLANEDSRVKVVHINDLPEGWLGKPYALMRGAEIANGDYLLFTDADVRFSEDAIRKAVALCEDRGFDQLGMAPDLWSRNFTLNVLLVTFVRTYGFGARLWALDNPNLEPFTGVGAFNLVRRSAYNRTEGFKWLKLDFGDDIALARLIKRSGGRTWVVNGVRDLDVDWYGSVSEMVTGLERVCYSTIGNYSASRTIIIALAAFISEFLPFICLLFVAGTWLQWVCIFMIALGMVNAIGMSRYWGGPVLPALLYPVGSAMLIYTVLRGGILGGLRGGVNWRGTFYPREMLIKGRRIGLP